MGMVWEVMEPGRGFCFSTLVGLCQHYGYLRNAYSPVLGDHGTLQEMTITTKAKYDFKCHGVPQSCGRVTTSDYVNLVSLYTEQTPWPAMSFLKTSVSA